MPGSEVIGQKMPDSSTWGTMTSGMNWRIWNSVRANVDRKMPRFTAAIASSSVITKASTGEPAMGTPRPMIDLRQRPDRGDVDRAEHEQQEQRDLERGEDAEAERVADDDLAAAHGRRHQPLERAADAFAQEADAGQDVDEEEDDEADERGRERVEERACSGCRSSAARSTGPAWPNAPASDVAQRRRRARASSAGLTPCVSTTTCGAPAVDVERHAPRRWCRRAIACARRLVGRDVVDGNVRPPSAAALPICARATLRRAGPRR